LAGVRDRKGPKNVSEKGEAAAAAGTGEALRIRSARVIVTCPGRNFVTLLIETDQGVTGIGDATLNGRELAVASYLTDHVIPNLIGRDAHRIEDIWQFLYRGAYWRRGPVTMSAIAAVDTALWDIKAKAAGLPLYQLLGGRSRDGVLVYGHANGADIEATVDQVGRYREMGYRAIRAQSGIPGVRGAYGVGRGDLYYEPADAALPTETLWSTPAYLDHAPKLFDRLRAVYGNEVELLHDVHHRLTPIEAARLGKALEPYRLFWMEDATPAENQEAFRLIRQHTTTPLAVGEIFNTIWDCRELIQNQLIDYIRATVVHAGGITHLRRIADLAALYQVRTGSHGATDLSPVCMGAALHFDTWVPNFGIQEYMRHTAETDAVFPHDYRFEDGYLIAGETPGHGVTIDENRAARYPYDPKQLPVARLADGTLWNW
jgi:mannonate dehydratase